MNTFLLFSEFICRKIYELLRSIVNRFYFYASVPFSHRILKQDLDKARIILQKASPAPPRIPMQHHAIREKQTCDLQIIVPAYNVEDYLEECIDSILAQETRYTYRVIIIDDGSTDGTGAIANHYAGDQRIEVIHQQNKGFSGARNTGLSRIFAKYIMFVDSDDQLASGAIEALLSEAENNNVSIVEGGFYLLANNKLSLSSCHCRKKVVSPLGHLFGAPWGKVFRSQLFENVSFPEGYWFEDSINSFLIYPQVERAMVIPAMVYKYRMHSASITRVAPKKLKCIDTYWITERMMEEHALLNLPCDEAYRRKVLRQIALNQKRLRFMSEEIQQSVFTLTADLFRTTFPPQQYRKANPLAKALNSNDFGLYCLYCKTH